MEDVRCPSCGFNPALLQAGDRAIRTPTHCVICSSPIGAAAGRPVAGSEPMVAEQHSEAGWATWLESRRIERWIWFLFMVGLAIAATIGLVRSAAGV